LDQKKYKGEKKIDLYINIIILIFVLLTGIAAVWLRNLVASAMLLGIYSLLMATLWVVLDAVDVAFTEAAVGAGITTALLLFSIWLTGKHEKKSTKKPWLPLIGVIATGGLLIFGTIGMPDFGDPNAPAHLHVAPYYLQYSVSQTTSPNVVTAVLASYRGFDTLGEVTVIFTAGIGVLALLTGLRRRRRSQKLEIKK
tara:strand:- start:30188 stop:30778 length:591 start_codon:yes stop_codon:yes gene_type:complete